MARKTDEEIAYDVIRGNYGNGANRKSSLAAAGYDPSTVQSVVNTILSGNKNTVGSYTPAKTTESYDDELDALYAKAPSYSSKYSSQIKSLSDQLMGRGAFDYDYETDPTYLNYEKAYTGYGRKAFDDALGRISAKTGGLASSYAGSVAQQSYNEYMSQLAGKIPELEALAYDMYTKEGDAMMDKLNAFRQLENDNYSRFQSEYSAYQDMLDAAKKTTTKKSSSDGSDGGAESGSFREWANEQVANRTLADAVKKPSLNLSGTSSSKLTASEAIRLAGSQKTAAAQVGALKTMADRGRISESLAGSLASALLNGRK